MHDSKDRYEVAAQEDRCAPRVKLSIPGQLRPSGARGFQTVIHDLSVSGFSASAVSRMHVGQLCWLTIPGLQSLQGEVVWWENCIAGCAFHELLSDVVHENILAKYTTPSVYRNIC